jgi:hypothetical protein
MYEGNGTPEDPTVRPNMTCSHAQCAAFASTLRITDRGVAILYCSDHERLAAKLFPPRALAVAA